MRKILFTVLISTLCLTMFAQNKVYKPLLKSPADYSEQNMVDALLNWSPVAGAYKYEYMVDKDETFSNLVIHGETQLSAVNTFDLEYGMTYFWRVRAKDTQNNISEWSDVWTFKTILFPELILPQDKIIENKQLVSVGLKTDNITINVTPDNETYSINASDNTAVEVKYENTTVVYTILPESTTSIYTEPYHTDGNKKITYHINSNGTLDDMCAVGYEFYRNGKLIQDIKTEGKVSYRVKLDKYNVYEQEIIAGEGMIKFPNDSELVEAFSLGFFDNFCVNRDRVIEFVVDFKQDETYTLISTLYACENDGEIIGTSFIAENCDELEYADKLSAKCDNPSIITQNTTIINNKSELEEGLPHFVFSEYEKVIEPNNEFQVTASLNSAGMIDELCSVGYEIYKDGQLISNVADYGTVGYKVRKQGNEYYEGKITEGSGVIKIEFEDLELTALTLGVLDNHCVSRNRNIEFTFNFAEEGEYILYSTIYNCDNIGEELGTSFMAINCDGQKHFDRFSEICENPIAVNQSAIEFKVEIDTQDYLPHFVFSNYEKVVMPNDDVQVVASLYSMGIIDDLCSIGYDIYKDGVLIDNVADYGTISYKLRKQGSEYQVGDIINGSGIIKLEYDGIEIEALTLGVVDNYCVSRNRNIDFQFNFYEKGNYELVATIYTCDNIGEEIGTSFKASKCDGKKHFDRFSDICENPTSLNQSKINFQVGEEVEDALPHFVFSNYKETLLPEKDIHITASLNSVGITDELCSIGYEIYKDGILIDNVADYGTVSYKLRKQGNEYQVGDIINGSGIVKLEYNGIEIEALTLGVVDNYCVSRNRNIDFTFNFEVEGNYEFVYTIYSCDNIGEEIGTSFNSTCDGEKHYDRFDEVCENPSPMNQNSINFNIKEFIAGEPLIVNSGVEILKGNTVLLQNPDETHTYKPADYTTGLQVSFKDVTLDFAANDYDKYTHAISPYFQWKEISGSTNYIVEVDLTPDFSSELKKTKITQAVDTTIIDLFYYGQEYYFRAKAAHSVDTSDWSLVNYFSTMDKPILEKPNPSAAGNLHLNVMPIVQLEWQGIIGSKKFQYEYSADPTFASGTIVNVPYSAFTITAPSTNPTKRTGLVKIAADTLPYGEKIYWRARSISDLDTSKWSDSFWLETISKVTISKPANNATDIALRPNLQWTAIEGSISYEVEYAKEQDFSDATTAIVPHAKADNISYDIPISLSPSTKYFWRVRAVSTRDKSDWAEASFTTKSSVSIETFSNEEALTVYPNPNNGNFNIDINTIYGSDYSIEVSNIIGQVVHSQTGSLAKGKNVIACQLENKLNGVYFVTVKFDKYIVSKKIVINK